MTTKTELLNNGVVVATKTAAPFYSWDWTPATSGASSLTYKRYEDNVLVFTSGAITGTVDAAAPASNYLIDTYSGSKLALSLRRQSELFTGSVLTVRNDSNVELGIGLNGDVLDTAAILSHIGSGNGFIVDWFSQDGNPKFTQTSASNQPKIAEAGAIITKNGKPAISFDGVDDFLFHSGALSYFTFAGDGTKHFVATCSSTPNNTAVQSLMSNTGGAADVNVFKLLYESTGYLKHLHGDDNLGSINTSSNLFDTVNRNIVVEHADPNNTVAEERSYLKLNGVLTKANIQTNIAATSSPTRKMGIGSGYGNGSYAQFTGTVQEINIWENDFLTEIDNIETNLNNYYVV